MEHHIIICTANQIIHAWEVDYESSLQRVPYRYKNIVRLQGKSEKY